MGFVQSATPFVEEEPPPDLSGVSAKIRRLLEEHLDVTGLRTVVKTRHITDPDFGRDFEQQGKTERELRDATIRKATELKRVTYERVQENPLRYQTFSERVLEVIRRFEQDQLDAASALEEFERITRELRAEDRAHEESGLNERAYGVLKILEGLAGDVAEGDEERGGAGDPPARVREPGPTPRARLRHLAEEIDEIYGSDRTAPPGWHLKDQLRRELRGEVRYRAHQAGLAEVKEVATRVEEYALRHYVKLS